MTQQERISKYMEILDKYDEGNSFWNWEILDQLSEQELFDENTLAEIMCII